MTTFGVKASALPAWERLQQALGRLDRPTVCRTDPDRWADPGDAETAEYAANLCRRCPVIEECSTFATANQEISGIWAGIDRTPQRGRPAAQPKGIPA